MSEESLDGRCIIGIRCRVHYGYLHLMHILLNFLSVVIGGIVDKDHRVLLPSWRVQVELGNEVPQEEHERILVGSSMAEGEVNTTICIKGSDH